MAFATARDWQSGGLAAGLTAALGLSGQAVFAGGFAQGQMGNPGVALSAGIGVALLVIGGYMQK